MKKKIYKFSKSKCIHLLFENLYFFMYRHNIEKMKKQFCKINSVLINAKTTDISIIILITIRKCHKLHVKAIKHHGNNRRKYRCWFSPQDCKGRLYLLHKMVKQY